MQIYNEDEDTKLTEQVLEIINQESSMCYHQCIISYRTKTPGSVPPPYTQNIINYTQQLH